MVYVKARLDDGKIVLPDSTKLRCTSGEVTVVFPDGFVERDRTPGRSIWDILDDGYRSQRTVDDVNNQIREMRDEWPDPRERVKDLP